MARRQKKYHYIYKTTCNVNGRYYIGMHSTDNLEDGYLGSGKRLWYSINYHGKENHTKEILEFCDTRKELKKREEEIVNEQLINEELCMNLKTGGIGGFCNDEHKNKAIKSSRESYKKRLNEDEEFRLRMLDNLRRGNITQWSYRTDYPTFKGRKHTEDTKKKMSEKAKQRTGKKNSQYGTCWITKDGENKKIKKEELSEYTSQGWVKGRKIGPITQLVRVPDS